MHKTIKNISNHKILLLKKVNYILEISWITNTFLIRIANKPIKLIISLIIMAKTYMNSICLTKWICRTSNCSQLNPTQTNNKTQATNKIITNHNLTEIQVFRPTSLMIPRTTGTLITKINKFLIIPTKTNKSKVISSSWLNKTTKWKISKYNPIKYLKTVIP